MSHREDLRIFEDLTADIEAVDGLVYHSSLLYEQQYALEDALLSHIAKPSAINSNNIRESIEHGSKLVGDFALAVLGDDSMSKDEKNLTLQAILSDHETVLVTFLEQQGVNSALIKRGFPEGEILPPQFSSMLDQDDPKILARKMALAYSLFTNYNTTFVWPNVTLRSGTAYLPTLESQRRQNRINKIVLGLAATGILAVMADKVYSRYKH